jgi:hypothetical protein
MVNDAEYVVNNLTQYLKLPENMYCKHSTTEQHKGQEKFIFACFINFKLFIKPKLVVRQDTYLNRSIKALLN